MTKKCDDYDKEEDKRSKMWYFKQINLIRGKNHLDDDDDDVDDDDDYSGTMCNCMQTNPHQRKGSLTNHSESGSVWFSRVSVLCVVQTTGDYRMIIEDLLNGEIF